MFLHKWAITMAVSTAAALAAAPTINGIGNSASNRLFSSPIAQGGIFIIQGSGLGPANISISSAPFQSTTLSNTSVSITFPSGTGTTTVSALMYYTSATQIAALLPSNTPTGTEVFTVTYNGQPSSAVNHGIVANNVGVFTLDSSGQGPGIATTPTTAWFRPPRPPTAEGPAPRGAANPGDTLSLWATDSVP